MKVKIGNKIYDSNEQPIMIILSNQDKLNITNMLPHCTKYACFPEDVTIESAKEFMRIGDASNEDDKNKR